ncbi:DUF1330 domain-containing protein [Luminiphilus sp.]|nr:DUF1330 domain-containing protein [Luminiphilus sp.]
MKVVNKVYPNKEQIKGFMEPVSEGPICMVNLLKFKDKAAYEDGRDTDLSGREAYALYEEGVKKLLQEIGGGIGFEGDVARLALGEVEELWDVVALAVWPSRGAMFEVMQSPEMQAISVHRSAGLAGQINIETTGFQGLWLKDTDQ